MSSPGNDLLLKIATFVAIIVAIVGGSFYIGAMLKPDRAPAPPTRVDVQVAPQEGSVGESESKPMQPMKDPMSEALLAMATRPTILPESELPGVEEELALVLPDLDRCWEGAVGENATAGKVFLHFTVDENGEVADLKVRSKGIGVPSVNTCFTEAARKRVFGNTEPGTSVYWPVVLDPETGPRLR